MIQSKLSIFGSILISDLYLFQGTVLLNPCLKFSKSLMLSFTAKIATGTSI